jgi:transcriptional regulator with XRE-family HTH domain
MGTPSLIDRADRKLHRRLIAFLIAERTRRKITQLELAMRLNVSRSWVARLECGERRVDVIEFIRLARCIGFDPCKTIMKQLYRDHPC